MSLDQLVSEMVAKATVPAMERIDGLVSVAKRQRNEIRALRAQLDAVAPALTALEALQRAFTATPAATPPTTQDDGVGPNKPPIPDAQKAEEVGASPAPGPSSLGTSDGHLERGSAEVVASAGTGEAAAPAADPAPATDETSTLKPLIYNSARDLWLDTNTNFLFGPKANAKLNADQAAVMTFLIPGPHTSAEIVRRKITSLQTVKSVDFFLYRLKAAAIHDVGYSLIRKGGDSGNWFLEKLK